MPSDGWNRAPHEEDCLLVALVCFLHVFVEIQTFIVPFQVGGIRLRDYDTAQLLYEKAAAQGD